MIKKIISCSRKPQPRLFPNWSLYATSLSVPQNFFWRNHWLNFYLVGLRYAD